MEERDVVEHLVAIVPCVQCPLPGVVVQHGDVRVLVMEWNVGVFVRRRVCVVRKVDFGSGQVGVGDVESSADQERLSGTSFGEPSVPGLHHLQGCRVQTADHHVPPVGDGGVNRPQPGLIRHEVDVRGATPGVWEGVVVASLTQVTLQ